MSARPSRKVLDDGLVLIKRWHRIEVSLSVDEMIQRIVEVSSQWIDPEVSRGVYIEGYSYETEEETDRSSKFFAAQVARHEEWERVTYQRLKAKFEETP